MMSILYSRMTAFRFPKLILALVTYPQYNYQFPIFFSHVSGYIMTNSSPDSSSDRQALCEDILARIRPTFNVEFEKLDVDGQELEILSIGNMEEHIDSLFLHKKIHDPLRDLPLWAKIWPASFILGRYLRKIAAADKSLLELGAGVGICSLIAARYGFSQITLSDSEEMALDFARANIVRNGLADRVRACRLDLRQMQNAKISPSYDVIAASELLYLDDLHRPILKLLERRLSRDGQAYFCTDIARLKPNFKKLAQKSFHVSEGHIRVKSQAHDGKEERRIYNILILEKS